MSYCKDGIVGKLSFQNHAVYNLFNFYTFLVVLGQTNEQNFLKGL